MINTLSKIKNNNFDIVKGFTMIELLVVIAIIGMLAGLALVSFDTAESQARDTQRKSDIKQYQTLLETFANQHSGLYPLNTGAQIQADTTLCTYLGATGCPADPRDGDLSCQSGLCRYYYQSGACTAGANGSGCATVYTLRFRLENESSWFVVCSNGQTGVAPAATNFQNGVCPSNVSTD